MPNKKLDKKVIIIGAGKLGQTLAKDVQLNKLADLCAICNKTLNSSQSATQKFNLSKTYESIQQLPSADFIFITTPDDIISQCAHELINNINIRPKTVVVHCSGVLSSEILYILKSKDCQIASFHPMRSFNQSTPATLKKAYCALEGDIAAIQRLKTLLFPLDINWLMINAEKKAIYHSGAVFSANYLIGILDQAQQAYQLAGIDKDTALKVSCDLAQSVLNNIKSTQSLKKSLTGPLARGDEKTIKLHLDNMKQNSKKLYKNLASELLNLCDLSKEKKSNLQSLLSLKKNNE